MANHTETLPTLPLEKIRTRLVFIWLGGSCILVVLLVLLSLIGDTFKDHVQELWNWALPNFVPTLGLMIAVSAKEALNPTPSGVVVRRNFCTIATSLSLFYLTLVLVTLLAHPVSSLDPLEILSMSGFYLAPLQGLADAALAVVFLSKEESANPNPSGGGS